jgi:hypothetical protein
VSDVSAAPNRSRITARVKRVEASTSSPGKWYLIVDILDATAIEGGLFPRVGTEGRVFTFGDNSPVDKGALFTAEVEYVGGPQGGEFQLHRLISRHGDVIPPDGL